MVMVSGIGIAGLSVVHNMLPQHGDLRYARFSGFVFCRKFIETGGRCHCFFRKNVIVQKLILLQIGHRLCHLLEVKQSCLAHISGTFANA